MTASSQLGPLVLPGAQGYCRAMDTKQIVIRHRRDLIRRLAWLEKAALEVRTMLEEDPDTTVADVTSAVDFIEDEARRARESTFRWSAVEAMFNA